MPVARPALTTDEGTASRTRVGSGRQAVPVLPGQGGQTESQFVGPPSPLLTPVPVLDRPSSGDALGPQRLGLLCERGQLSGVLIA